MAKTIKKGKYSKKDIEEDAEFKDPDRKVKKIPKKKNPFYDINAK